MKVENIGEGINQREGVSNSLPADKIHCRAMQLCSLSAANKNFLTPSVFHIHVNMSMQTSHAAAITQP